MIAVQHASRWGKQFRFVRHPRTLVRIPGQTGSSARFLLAICALLAMGLEPPDARAQQVGLEFEGGAGAPPEPGPGTMGGGLLGPDEIRLTTLSIVTAPLLGIRMRLEYGSRHAGETWAIYSSDWHQARGRPPMLAEAWERASLPFLLSPATNQVTWTEQGQLGRAPMSQVWVRAYAAGSLGDADADGLPDADEALLYGTNPFLDDDWDGDGLTDGEEMLVCGTNPKLRDSDGDGVEDGLEITQGRNPLVAGAVSDADGWTALQVFTPDS